MLDTGFLILVSGYWLLIGYWLLFTGCGSKVRYPKSLVSR
ncbi:MAG TPA: D-galactonate transporter [Deltaproteobacteria bacterium]|nr:D-galactonate transporter [Deltaproteobacteria bacterium]